VTTLAFVLLLALGVPIAFVLIGSTFVFMLAEGNWRLLNSLPQVLFSSLEIFDLLAIPLFILLGEILNAGGLTRRLIAAAQSWLTRLPNALAYVSLTANLMLASIMGSATAQIAVMSRVMVPAMEADGYSRSFAAALTASAGLLGPVIPPSIIFIIYGVVAQVSIAQMFLAGILPGLLLFTLLCAWIAIRSPRRVAELAAGSERLAPPSRLAATRDAIAILTIPAVIVGGIAYGLFTPTESAAVAIFVALVISLFYREIRLADVPVILTRCAANTAIVLFLIAAAKVFGWVLTFNMVPQSIARLIQGMTDDPTMFMLLVFALLILVGVVLDGIAALIILVPILLPIATGIYGIDPIFFGIVASITLTLGLLTPPVGAGLYVASVVGEVPIGGLIREIIPFIGLTMLVVLLVIFFPGLTSALR
jgi:TRAP-type transport system large permease protein